MSLPHVDGNGRHSFWLETSGTTRFPAVTADEEADVVIVGGGIVGVSLAYALARNGRDVIVVDRERIASAETGHTTAHLQTVTDTAPSKLVERIGMENTRLALDSQQEAVRFIEEAIQRENIACGFERLDAFLYAARAEDVERLREDGRLLREMGHAAEVVGPESVPFEAHAVLRLPDQGKFHPRKYLLGLAASAERAGVRFREGTHIEELGDDDQGVWAKTREGHTLRGAWLVQATNVPLTPRVRVHDRLGSHRTYAIAARVPEGVFPDALLWDTLDPYHYVRLDAHEGQPLVILGGADHPVGHDEDTEACYQKLEAHLRTATPEFEVLYRWSGEWIETPDGLPFIGETPGASERMLLVTGDSGTGMTNGTLGALMLAERILGRGTPWDELYAPDRLPQSAGPLKQVVAENADVARQFVKGKLQRSEIESLEDLAPGDGAIVSRGLKKVAVSRGRDGRLRALDAACTHMGCTVAWNRSEQSWDCPCHGGRFDAEGEILHGPPPKPLGHVALDEVEERLGGATQDTRG